VREPTTILGVAGLKKLAILVSESKEMAPLNSRIIKEYLLAATLMLVTLLWIS